ncbi:hypothetical protein BC629DRAFT_1590717 [Irpex lacteus]|nr:hypothetical protein BC629DRAFT_1590717 [Irpex lacteus]
MSKVIAVVIMMLMNVRNVQFNAFQKLIGVWLFANSATRELYDLLCRMGFSIAYSAVLDLLKDLAGSAQDNIRARAIARRFKLVYDNINRQRRVWDGELGERDIMQSGTAAMFVVLEDCNLSASDVAVLERAHAEKRRQQLNLGLLERRIDDSHLRDVFAVHIVSFLVQEVPCLAPLQKRLNHRLRVDLAKHRMRDGRQTEVYPLATSEHNEGSTQGNREVIDDLMLNQLQLPEEEVSQMITILGGDQSTVEKIRTLKKFMNSCPHGYHRYGWVLPVVELWHMGWADLERILATHWGHKTGSEEDISTLGFVNQLLNRKVKNVTRPDYYPAQNLVFDTLRMEVLDCWCEYFGTDLNGLESTIMTQIASDDSEEVTIKALLTAASKIAHMYMFTLSADVARAGPVPDNSPPWYIQFPIGRPWKSSSRESTASVTASGGDDVLANTILRMRDSMLHFEFHSAIADGDIGRAMNIMNVWVFTFCGSGKSKYTNELLEVACNFEFEYPESLKQDQLNNWLSNLTGQLGRWFPMDLLMEHNINLLKKMSGRHAAPFTSQFFKETVSLNIRHFLDVKESLRIAVRLGARTGTHKKKKKRTAMEHLARTMRENELHRFRTGRTYNFVAQDDFEQGWERFARTSRISDFIERTLADGTVTDLHEPGSVDPQTAEDTQRCTEDESVDSDAPQVPLPHVWENGQLIQGIDENSDSESEDEKDMALEA